jgi:hypothetical protein
MNPNLIFLHFSCAEFFIAIFTLEKDYHTYPHQQNNTLKNEVSLALAQLRQVFDIGFINSGQKGQQEEDQGKNGEDADDVVEFLILIGESDCKDQ